MNESIQKLADELRLAIIEEVSDITVSVSVLFNLYDSDFETLERTPESLKEADVDIRNIKGKWIREGVNREQIP